MAKSQLPPQDPEAEAALIGGILFGERYGKAVDLDSVREIVSPEMFYAVPPHRYLFQAIVDAADQGEPIEAASLLPRLRRADPNENWQEVVNDLDHQGDAANAVYYAGQIREAWCKRELLRLSHELEEQVNSNDPDLKAADIVEATDKRLRSIGPGKGRHGPVMRRFSEIERRELQWLWRNRIPQGKITTLAGYGELGKTFIGCCDIPARLSRGRGWPDSRNTSNPASDTIIVSLEDDPEDTLGPRLDANDADCNRIHFLDGVADRQADGIRPFTLDDVRHLETTLRRNPNVKLVVLDPLGGFMPKHSDSHKDADTRRALGPLRQLAADFQVAVLGIAHLGKNIQPGTVAAHRVLGSVGLVNASRSVWLVFADPADSRRRLLLPAKCNLSPTPPSGLAFRIVPPGQVQWEAETIDQTADEFVSEAPRARTARDEAANFLGELLASGPMPSIEIYEVAKANRINERTLHRAKTEIGARARKRMVDGKSTWFWELSQDD